MLFLFLAGGAAAQVSTAAAPTKPSGQSGVLLIRTNLSAHVNIDGQPRGETKAGAISKYVVTAGKHILEVEGVAGKECWEKKITVPPGTQVVEIIELTGVRRPAETGSVMQATGQERDVPRITYTLLLALGHDIEGLRLSNSTLSTSLEEGKLNIAKGCALEIPRRGSRNP